VQAGTNWTTFMGDQVRSGVGSPTPVATRAHRTWTAPVDGDVYGEPLIVDGAVIATTEQDSVYSLDAGSGAVRWRTHLGQPVPLSELVCGDIDPNGITSTPVVDIAAGVVYAVAMLDTPLRHELFALRLTDGGVVWHRQVDPAMRDPRIHQQRGALNLVHGRIYISYGGFTGDCGGYNGWVISAPATGSGALNAWEVPSAIEGGIWAPAGPVISAAGDVWVSTGNTGAGTGSTSGSWDGANAVFHLDGALSASADSWAPANWRALNITDTDLGSLSPALLPGGDVFVAGKEGVGYLLRAGHLGGVGGEAFKETACLGGGPLGGAFGGAAVSGQMVYVPCTSGLTALKVDETVPSFGVAWRSGQRANSPTLAYGLVWSVTTTQGFRQDWTGTLVGFDAQTGAARFTVGLGPIPHFATPAAAGGSLYIGGRGTVAAVSVV
jgi:outer membrane protein assembly factor BamB